MITYVAARVRLRRGTPTRPPSPPRLPWGLSLVAPSGRVFAAAHRPACCRFLSFLAAARYNTPAAVVALAHRFFVHHRHYLAGGLSVPSSLPPAKAGGASRGRCPCRAPAAGVLPAAPAGTPLWGLSLRSAQRLGATPPLFFRLPPLLAAGVASHIFSLDAPAPSGCAKKYGNPPRLRRNHVHSRPFAGAHAARTPL